MKYVFSFLLLIALLSCDEKSETNPGLVGTWQLEAVYSDPGDGSGDFVIIDSALQLEFRANGTFTANGSICSLSGGTGETISGTYDDEAKTLETEDCNTGFRLPSYELVDDELTLSLPCIEACLMRFDRVF